MKYLVGPVGVRSQEQESPLSRREPGRSPYLERQPPGARAARNPHDDPSGGAPLEPALDPGHVFGGSPAIPRGTRLQDGGHDDLPGLIDQDLVRHRHIGRRRQRGRRQKAQKDQDLGRSHGGLLLRVSSTISDTDQKSRGQKVCLTHFLGS